MKTIAITLFLLTFCIYAFARGGNVAVRGYIKRDGTFVQPHMRSAPDGNFNNNWSTSGNLNPYTGQSGKKLTPDKGSTQGEYALPLPLPLSLPAQSLSPTYEDPSSTGTNGTTLPPHTKINTLTNQYECERGYLQVGQECLAVPIPLNAKLNYFGNGWECARGYRQLGQECAAVQIPSNAKLNFYGNGWECERGYRQSGLECAARQ